MAYDLLIKDGTVVDGSGAPGYRADVAIQGGKVVDVGRIRNGGARTLDAAGLTVAPGFIDMHTHYDCQLFWDPLATSSCWHGVTTVLTGNCGYTVAPGGPSRADYLMNLMAVVEGIPVAVLRHLDWDWESFGQYLRKLQKNLGVNVAAQVGHSAVRYYVMGPESYERAATQDEIVRMKGVVRQAMADGAVGFSTLQSLHQTGAYGKRVPSQLSTPEEVRELCGVVGEFGRGIVTANARPGASEISPEFQDFLISLSKAISRPVMWNQFFHRWDKPDLWRDMLKFMERASSEGGQVYALARCQSMDLEFNLVRTSMFDRFPAWKAFLSKPLGERSAAASLPGVRAALRQEWDREIEEVPARRTALLQVARTKLPLNKKLEGRRLAELASEAGKHPVDFLLDLALEEDLETQFVYVGSQNGDPEAVAQIINDPRCLPGASDAGAHLDNDCGVDFIGVLLGHWVRERGVMTLEEAVRRLTSMAAGLLGITDRGLLRPGMAADVVVFDPTRIRALPREMAADLPGGGQRIIQRAAGVRAVVVNGQTLIEDGRHTGAMSGAVLGLARDPAAR